MSQEHMDMYIHHQWIIIYFTVLQMASVFATDKLRFELPFDQVTFVLGGYCKGTSHTRRLIG